MVQSPDLRKRGGQANQTATGRSSEILTVRCKDESQARSRELIKLSSEFTVPEFLVNSADIA